MAKTFSQLKDTDFIYQLNPFTLTIEGMRVKGVTGVVEKLIRGNHPTPHVYKHAVQVEFYRREVILHSADLDKVPTVKLIVDGRESSTLMQAKIDGMGDILYPIPVVTDKNQLQQWMDRTK